MCLYACDEDLRGLALVERRALLRKHLKRSGPALLYSDHLDAQNGEAMFRHACRMGLEGIVSKRVDSRYKSGRCRSWVKVKNPVYERRRLGACRYFPAPAAGNAATGQA